MKHKPKPQIDQFDLEAEREGSALSNPIIIPPHRASKKKSDTGKPLTKELANKTFNRFYGTDYTAR